jgi:hypothetical protein
LRDDGPWRPDGRWREPPDGEHVGEDEDVHADLFCAVEGLVWGRMDFDGARSSRGSGGGGDEHDGAVEGEEDVHVR